MIDFFGRNPLTSGQCFLQVYEAIRNNDSLSITSQSPHIGSMFLTLGQVNGNKGGDKIVAIPSHRVNVSYSLLPSKADIYSI